MCGRTVIYSYQRGNKPRKTKEGNTMKNEMTKRANTYRLPNPTTPEDLECIWNKVLNFGDKVVMTGHFYNGMNKPCYFGAVYEHLDDDMTCEGTIGLAAVSAVEFWDDGHAIAWALQEAAK